MMNVGVWLGNLKQIKHYNDNVQTLTESMLDALRKPKRQDSYSSGHTSQLLQETASDADVGLARFGDQDDDESSSGDDQIVDFSKKKPKKKTDKNKRKNREDEEEVESEEEDVEEEEEQRPSKKPNKKPKRKETSEEEVEEEEESPKKPKQKVKPPSKHRESEEEPDISDKGHDKRPLLQSDRTREASSIKSLHTTKNLTHMLILKTTKTLAERRAPKET
jgi:outer membrane biosynthesis protein TonB